MKALTKAGIVAALTATLALPTAAAAMADEQVRPRAVSMCGSYYAGYWDRAQCEQIGQAGVGTGRWWAYVCEEDVFDWNLYVCY
ncbi:hypothetical protein ACTG9Q_18080 [Actinokineospora sp. 24-640]